MATENTPVGSGSLGPLDEPGHSGARPMDALKGSMGPVFMQAAGLNMDQGEPESAANTSEAPDGIRLTNPITPPGIGGAAANSREDHQGNVF